MIQADAAAQEVLRNAPPEKRRAAYEMARRRHRAAWRNFAGGLAALVLVVAAVIGLAALV